MNRDELVTGALPLAKSLSRHAARHAAAAGRTDNAEDLYQIACLEVVEAADRFMGLGRPESEWQPYVNTCIRWRIFKASVVPEHVAMSASTARSCQLGKASAAAQRAFSADTVQADEVDEAAPLVPEPSDAAVRVFQLLAKADIADADRDAVKLYYLDELTHAQVAEAMGWTVATTRKRISRALARIREVER